MSKKLVHDVALIATQLHEAGLTFNDAELAAQYCLAESLTAAPGYLARLLEGQGPRPLIRGFCWGDTPEGDPYWAARYWAAL